MKNVMNGTYFKGEESFNFKFYTDLTIANKMKFVNSVVDLVVGDEYYNSVIRNLVFDFYLIDIMSDVDTTEFKKSDSFLDSVEEFLEETNVVDVIKANAKDGLIEELNKAVDKSIEYKTGIHTNPLGEALASLANTIEKKIGGIDLKDAMDMVAKFSGMTEELTPESVVNAYINSDMHKNNLNEIAESKKEKKNEINLDENLGKIVRAIVEENKADD